MSPTNMRLKDVKPSTICHKGTGFAMVPVDATDAMMAAFAKAVTAELDWHEATEVERQEVRDGFGHAYRAMLAAAPKPSPTPQADSQPAPDLEEILSVARNWGEVQQYNRTDGKGTEYRITFNVHQRAAHFARELCAARAPAPSAGPMQFGGCPECGSRSCVARECSRTVSHAAQAIPGVQWQCGQQARGFTAQLAPACQHRIVDARNPIVKSGYVCLDCRALFAAGDHGVAPADSVTAPAADSEPIAYLYDDGSWTPAKTEEGRKLNDWMISAGSPKIGVHLASTSQPTPPHSPPSRRPGQSHRHP